jgi:hypothetical protein
MRTSDKTVNIRLDHDLYMGLVELRKQIGVPAAESVRRAVRDYLAKHNIHVDSESVQISDLPNQRTEE